MSETGLPIRYYLDACVPKAVAKMLRERDMDVMTADEADMLLATDDQHLAYATADRRVLVTQDVACLHWHTDGFWHKGIVYARPETPPEDIVRVLLKIGGRLTLDDMIGHLELVNSA